MSNLKPQPSQGALPAGAPARRVRLDFGPAPIRSYTPPCRIIGSAQPKTSRGYLLDNE